MSSCGFLTKAQERRPRVGTGATSTSHVETLDEEGRGFKVSGSPLKIFYNFM